MSVNYHDGRRDRMRERYTRHGLDNFTDHEVLEVLLYYSVARRDTNELAHKLLNDFGSLDVLFEADPLDIKRISGVSEQTAVLISMVPHLAGRYYNAKFAKKAVLDSSDLIGAFCISLFSGKNYECFYCICLDNRRKLIAAAKISEGTVNEVNVYPRRAAQEALKYNAVCVVLAHNHPSGDSEPSADDFRATATIKSALHPLGIETLDHIIVGGGNYYSFAEHKKI